MSCPTCARPMPVEAPCLTCWADMSPEARAPWIRRMRSDPSLSAVAHRDPVRSAPPTLAAYVAYLEQLQAPVVWPGFPPPELSPPDPVVVPGPDDLVCPRCGARLLWGGSMAHCIRSGWATTRRDHPQIGDMSCDWTGPIVHTPDGGVELAERSQR